MWPKFYRDYPVDKPLIKARVESGRGIIGCEMHDLNGWGNTLHVPRKMSSQERGTWLHRLTRYLRGKSKRD